MSAAPHTQPPPGVAIRQFRAEDVPALEDILRKNGQFDHPEVEGGAAMQRFSRYPGNVFLVAVRDGLPIGLLRAVYDGSRAVIHLLSVHPAQQRQGVGTALARVAMDELRILGAPTVSATVWEGGGAFWDRLGFEPLPVRIHLKRP